MVHNRVNCLLVVLVAAQLILPLLCPVVLNAQALSVGVATRAIAPNRVARTFLWGIIKPFRTKFSTDSTDQSQVYKIGLQSAIKTTNRSEADHILGATQNLRAGSANVYTATIPRRRVKLRHMRDLYYPDATDYVLTPPTVTTTNAKAEVSEATGSLIGSLIRPFEESLDQGEINLDRLIAACKQYTDAVYNFGQKAMGENLKQNLQNIEEAKAMAPKEHQTTLRSLLEYEKATGVRPDGGKLRESSAAMGFLWIRRSLAFQYRLNEILVEDPDLPAPKAAMEAYEQEVQPYHSWGLQKMFKLALRSTTPQRPKALAQLRGSPSDELGPIEESQTLQDLRSLGEAWQPLLLEWKSTFESLGLEDDSKA